MGEMKTVVKIEMVRWRDKRRRGQRGEKNKKVDKDLSERWAISECFTGTS